MTIKKKTLYVVIGISIVALCALWGAYHILFTSNVEKTPSSIANEELEWREIVELLISDSKRLEIEYYATGERTLIDKGDPLFDEILNFLEFSTLKKATKKTVVIGNMSVSITIPYPYGYFLTFELRNGSKLRLDLEDDTIWFETESTIYEVKVGSDLVELVREVLSRTGISLSRHEVYKEGLKLIVTLSSLELRSGDILTINATLFNVNNTANITIAASHGGMDLRIYDSHNNTVYAVKVVTPGPTAPFPVFKPRQKISDVFKWNTSEKVLSGSNPPSPGKYYIEVEAYVTDLGTNSKLILRTDVIEVIIL